MLILRVLVLEVRVHNHGSVVLLVLVDVPVQDVVVLERLADEKVMEDLAQLREVGLVIETQLAAVVQVDDKLVGNQQHNTSMGVVIFISMMRSYFYFLVAAFRPRHGREPRQK
jgi:hypothetical protein